MPTDHVTTSYAYTAIADHRREKPPPAERAGKAAAFPAASIDMRYHRAWRVIDDDRRRAAESSRPPHCCALLNTIADHHIETIASYLTSRDRMNLRHAARRLRHALRADAAIDALAVKIDKVLSPSLLRRALAESQRFPAARASLIAMLAAQVEQFCPPHAERGLGMIVDAIDELPPERQALPLASTGPLLRGRPSDPDSRHPGHRAMTERLMEAVERLPASVRARTLAAVLDAGSTDRPQRASKVGQLVAQLDQYPPADRAALLLALIEQFDHRTGTPDQSTWRLMVDRTVALPPACQARPLRALASHPGIPQALARERWDHMMQASLDLPDASRAAIYAGLARTVPRLPNVRFDPETRRRVQWLNSAIADLPCALLPPVLEAFAPNLLRAGFGDCWGGVVASIRRLPVERRLAPLRALTSGVWPAQWRDMAADFSNALLEAARELPPDDLAVLLGDYARRAGTLQELNRVFDACLELPLALRRWALAALASQPFWVLADNARPIAQVLLPMIDGMDASHRTLVIGELLQMAFNCKDACPQDVPGRHMPAATWKALERAFGNLPPQCKEQILTTMARSIRDPMTPAWTWVLHSARGLPAARQPQIMSQLASVSYLTDIPGTHRPIRMVAAAAAALPRHYRAMPLWAVQRAKNNAEEHGANMIAYVQCCWSIFRLESGLPEEDRF